MNYVVMGAGAIGCYVGGRLAWAGHSVHFVGRPKVLAMLRQHGLTVTDLDGFQSCIPGDQLQLAEHLEAPFFCARLHSAVVRQGWRDPQRSARARSAVPRTHDRHFAAKRCGQC